MVIFCTCFATIDGMVEKVVRKVPLNQSSIRENLAFWLGKAPEERLAAIERLRKQIDGSTVRLQRVARVIQRPSG